ESAAAAAPVVWRNSRREEDRLRGLVGEFMFPFLSDRKGKQIFSSVLGGMSLFFSRTPSRA
ncbi:MAG: hypothetical protein KC940_00020, partial [Candidatus Omnitrophica bacterium]|nr:hypothetical protein [Candidatus Omnitrophota bacterium]